VKRRDLIRKITRAAKDTGIDFELQREGANHSVFRCGGQPVVIPRHNEINELTAKGIMTDLEGELGTGWWK
jgi:mRNA interferase HicA